MAEVASQDPHPHDYDDGLAGTLDPVATHDAARESAVVVWWQLTAFLEVAGAQAIELVEGLASQHIDGIEPGTARHALFLTNKARIVAATVAYRAAADRLLLELDPALAEVLAIHLRRYRLRARATIEPVDLGAISVVGPDSARWQGDGWFDAGEVFGLPARTFVGPRAQASTLVSATLPAAGVELAHPEAFDALRIAMGVPALADLAPGFMPAEVGGMDVAVSLTKGCYLGQEPVARLHYRGRANRTLRQVRLDRDLPDDYFGGRDPTVDDSYLALARAGGDADPGAAGPGPFGAPAGPGTTQDPRAAAARPVGTLTSWAHAPDGGIVGLATLRREVADGDPLVVVGTEVQVTPLASPTSS